LPKIHRDKELEYHQPKQMTNQNPPQKNIVYDSTIIAGGNVHIGEARFQEIVAQLPQS